MSILYIEKFIFSRPSAKKIYQAENKKFLSFIIIKILLYLLIAHHEKKTHFLLNNAYNYDIMLII